MDSTDLEGGSNNLLGIAELSLDNEDENCGLTNQSENKDSQFKTFAAQIQSYGAAAASSVSNATTNKKITTDYTQLKEVNQEETKDV